MIESFVQNPVALHLCHICRDNHKVGETWDPADFIRDDLSDQNSSVAI
jgi:hypothetical protein